MNLKISARALSFCAHFMAKQDIRYYLNGVCVTPMPADIGGVLVAATDGHTMGMWHDAKGEADRQVIMRVSPGLLSAAAKGGVVRTVGERLAVVHLNTKTEIEDNEAYVQANEDRAYADPKADVERWEIPGKFPDVLRVVPDLADLDRSTGQHLGAINAKYLARIEKAMPKTGKYGSSCIIRQKNADSAALVQFPQQHEAAVVIMPMRSDLQKDRTWLHRWQAKNRRDADLPSPGQRPSDAAPPDQQEPLPE